MGMHAEQYYYAGGFDDWFLDTDSPLTAEELAEYFKASLSANGGDMGGPVDALSEPGSVTLRQGTDGTYPTTGQLVTKAALCALSGTGRVSVTSEYTAGVTSIAEIETATSDDLEEWSAWQTVGVNGELQSPNRQYIRFRVTLATQDTARSPKVLEIQLHDIPKAPYEKLGFARPVVLDTNGAWEAVLENAFDIIVTSEVNGADTLEFSLPFHDTKRAMLDNEKQVQIVNDIYRVRTLTDTKDFGKVYNEAVELCAYLCKEYGMTEKNIICHSEGHAQGIASNHGDVMHWFPKHGKNMDTFRAAVKERLSGTSGGSTSGILYRVRKSWADKASQKGAFKVLDNAKRCADENAGYSVFDEGGKAVYTGKAAYATYTVKKGDSLWAIAVAKLGNGSRYPEIKKLNGLTSDVIHAGQVLKIPN